MTVSENEGVPAANTAFNETEHVAAATERRTQSAGNPMESANLAIAGKDNRDRFARFKQGGGVSLKAKLIAATAALLCVSLFVFFVIYSKH